MEYRWGLYGVCNKVASITMPVNCSPFSGDLQLIDWSSRLIRPGKANLSTDVPHILTRLQINAESWQATLEKLIKTTRFVGAYFGSATRLNETATQRAIKYLKDVAGRETPLTTPHAS